jgi:glycosyltransferase involved in cell wall biosynthesis
MLSFIVPAYNEERELPLTIRAIHDAVAESRIDEYELIVVDDGSTDSTARIAQEAGARLVSIKRRHIAASRNAGGHAAEGNVLFFVDADTRINAKHIADALAALQAGCSGGSARIVIDGQVPRWARIFLRIFSTIYFANKLGAGAFLFTTRANFQEVGGFDEQYFAGEEIYFTQALKKLGRFEILREPMITSGRKLRMYSASHILSRSFAIIIRGPRAARSRDRLDLWYSGEREKT